MKSFRPVLKRFLFVLTLCVLMSSGTAYAARTKLVPMKKLQRYTYFRKYMSKKQLKKAYDKAKPIVKPLLGKSKADQLIGVAVGLRQLVDSGKVGYEEETLQRSIWLSGQGVCFLRRLYEDGRPVLEHAWDQVFARA